MFLWKIFQKNETEASKIGLNKKKIGLVSGKGQRATEIGNTDEKVVSLLAIFLQ